MSREKQIEEMEKIIQKCDDEAMYASIANKLYEAGYRKQSDIIDEFLKRLKERNKIYCVNETDLKEMNFVIDQIAREMKGGASIPEGRQICIACEDSLKNYKPNGVKTKRIKKSLRTISLFN